LGRLRRKYFGTLSSESIDSQNDGRPEKVIRTNKKVFNKNGVFFSSDICSNVIRLFVDENEILQKKTEPF
jgi:hypothetical protein